MTKHKLHSTGLLRKILSQCEKDKGLNVLYNINDPCAEHEKTIIKDLVTILLKKIPKWRMKNLPVSTLKEKQKRKQFVSHSNR